MSRVLPCCGPFTRSVGIRMIMGKVKSYRRVVRRSVITPILQYPPRQFRPEPRPFREFYLTSKLLFFYIWNNLKIKTLRGKFSTGSLCATNLSQGRLASGKYLGPRCPRYVFFSTLCLEKTKQELFASSAKRWHSLVDCCRRRSLPGSRRIQIELPHLIQQRFVTDSQHLRRILAAPACLFQRVRDGFHLRFILQPAHQRLQSLSLWSR